MATPAGPVSKAENGEGKGGQRTTSVSVDDSETWVESKRYTVYKVVVRKADRAYFVFRRYVTPHSDKLVETASWSLYIAGVDSIFRARLSMARSGGDNRKARPPTM